MTDNTELKDDFRGDDANLIRSIEALISLSDEGALVPHGIGGHARGLLSAAAVRLTRAAPQPQGGALTDERAAFDKFRRNRAFWEAGDSYGWEGVAWLAWQTRAILAQSAPQLPEDDMALLRPHMSQRTGQLSHGVQQFLKEYADPEYRQRMHEARKRLYAPSAPQQAGDGLTDVEVRDAAFRDCIDAIQGAIAFGRQGTNLPPEGHWLAEFWSLGSRLAAPRQPGEMGAGVRPPIGYVNERTLRILADGTVSCTHISPTQTEFQQVAIFAEAP